VSVFMSTHILSDIEALCDEVAILRGGKLAAAGKLGELLAKDDAGRSLIVEVQGVKADEIRASVEFIAGASIEPAPDGANIRILDESDLDAVLDLIRKSGGRLTRVEPAKLSLEDLFT